MKKAQGVVILGLFLISMLSFVAAAPQESFVNGVQTGVDTVISALNPIFKQIIGDTDEGDVFLAKILFLIIIFSIVWKAMERIDFFSENEWVLWVISTAVSILAIRWLGSSDIVTTILLPYSALGIAVMSGLPFILYFLIVEGFKSRTIRKVSWIFFIVVFIGLWIMRTGDDAATATKVTGFAWIYLTTAGLALAVLIFDKTIQRTYKKAQYDANRELAEAKRRTMVIEKRNKLEERKLSNDILPGDYKSQDEELKKLEKKYHLI